MLFFLFKQATASRCGLFYFSKLSNPWKTLLDFVSLKHKRLTPFSFHIFAWIFLGIQLPWHAVKCHGLFLFFSLRSRCVNAAGLFLFLTVNNWKWNAFQINFKKLFEKTHNIWCVFSFSVSIFCIFFISTKKESHHGGGLLGVLPHFQWVCLWIMLQGVSLSLLLLFFWVCLCLHLHKYAPRVKWFHFWPCVNWIAMKWGQPWEGHCF